METIVRMARWVARDEHDQMALDLWWSKVRPVWDRQPGLIQVHLLARLDSRDRMTISVWRSEADYARFRVSEDLAVVAHDFAEVYADDGWPHAEEWSVLTRDWPLP